MGATFVKQLVKSCAVLCCAVLCCAVHAQVHWFPETRMFTGCMCCAVLCCVVLCCAVLCCAVLCCAVLCCVVLCCAACCAGADGGDDDRVGRVHTGVFSKDLPWLMYGYGDADKPLKVTQTIGVRGGG